MSELLLEDQVEVLEVEVGRDAAELGRRGPDVGEEPLRRRLLWQWWDMLVRER